MPENGPPLSESIFVDPNNKGAEKMPSDPKPREWNDGEGDGTKTRTPAEVAEFLATAVKRFARVTKNESMNRNACVEDLKFLNGEQWDEKYKNQRSNEKRPCLTVNKMKTFVHQITNEQRMNRPAIIVSPEGDKGDRKSAEVYYGLIRHIEKQSQAEKAYDTGFWNACANGFGWWRINSQYCSDDSFDQDLVVERIRNPLTVYSDPDSQTPETRDKKWCFISEMVPREEFRELYPDADQVQWTEAGPGDQQIDWSSVTHIRVAEYYWIETKGRELVALDNGFIGWEDKLDDSARKFKVKKRRTVMVPKVMYAKITSKEILEEHECKGKYIPLVRTVGDEIDIEGKLHLSGIVRDAKDAQRMYNYWVTSETEMVALAPKAPYIMEEGQVEGHEKAWAKANNSSMPYLLYKGTNVAGSAAPPPQRQPYAGPPMGIVQAKQGAAQDMQATTGIRFDSTMQERMTDESGIAIRGLKQNQEIGSYHYIDNFGSSLKFTAEIFIDLIPFYYDTERTVTILREDNTTEAVEIKPAQTKAYDTVAGEDGKRKSLFNPKQGKYEVTVTIGPSFATKRIEAAESMVQFLKVYPMAAPLIGDLIAEYQDWPGAERIAARLKLALPPEMQKLDDLEDLSPQAKAAIGSLTKQLQQAVQQRDQVMQAVQEKTTEHMIDVFKIDKDFEAKMTKIFLDAMGKGLDAAKSMDALMISQAAEGKPGEGGSKPASAQPAQVPA